VVLIGEVSRKSNLLALLTARYRLLGALAAAQDGATAELWNRGLSASLNN
jgi:hypothetical protein